MKIIGITGTLGAGKGTVVDYLCREPHNYKHYSARSLLNEIIAERGMPPGRDSMRTVANGMRAEKGPAALILALFEKARVSSTSVPSNSLSVSATAYFEKAGWGWGGRSASSLRFSAFRSFPPTLPLLSFVSTFLLRFLLRKHSSPQIFPLHLLSPYFIRRSAKMR